MGGRLVAIVNAKQSAAGIEGLGFAIPINLIEDAVANITEFGYVKNRPGLGIQTTSVESGFLMQYAQGLYVTGVDDSSSPLRENDRIISINGITIESLGHYNEILNGLTIGDSVKLVIMRNNRQYTATVEVIENTHNDLE